MSVKNTYSQQQYKCPAGHITTHYVWSKEISTTTHQCHCGQHLTGANVVIPKKNQVTAIRTPTKNR